MAFVCWTEPSLLDMTQKPWKDLHTNLVYILFIALKKTTPSLISTLELQTTYLLYVLFKPALTRTLSLNRKEFFFTATPPPLLTLKEQVQPKNFLIFRLWKTSYICCYSSSALSQTDEQAITASFPLLLGYNLWIYKY